MSLLILSAYWLSSESLGYSTSTNQMDYIFKAVVKVTYSILKKWIILHSQETGGFLC